MKKLFTFLVLAVLLLTGCSKKETPVVTAVEGFAYGKPGDIMRTAFFDLTVNEAKKTDSYGDLKPSEGKAFLVVNITVKETQNRDIEMYDTDFQIQWGDGDQDFGYPVTAYENEPQVSGNMLKDVYPLAAGESASGELVFEVPSESEKFAFGYQEVYSNQEKANIFFVVFQAK